MTLAPSSPPVLADLIAQGRRRWRGGRREKPFRFLMDARLFRLLCDPGQRAALASFRAALARLRLARDGGLPDLEMTPLAVLDAIGVEPPRFPSLPYLPKDMETLENVEVCIVIRELIHKDLLKAPELQPESLRWRVEALRDATDPAAHDLFDLCLTRFVSCDKFEDRILEQLTIDGLFTFRFPEEYRDRMNHLFNVLLLNNGTQVAGVTKMRRLKPFWDRSLLRILRKHPKERSEILAVDQELKPRTYKDFLGWEVIHHSVLGYARKQLHPVVAFAPYAEDRLRKRCKVHKSALRAFLDDIAPDELAGDVLRPLIAAWTPGWLIPCRSDGTMDAPFSTADVPIWAGPPNPPPPQSEESEEEEGEGEGEGEKEE